MTEPTAHFDRRTVLGSIASSTLIPLAGCIDSGTGQSGSARSIRDVSVSGVQLVVELRADADIDQLTVIDPDGEEFATRAVAAGVTRETFELGTAYVPGSYEVHAVTEGESVDETSLEIRPDVRITDVKLGRNHPDEMYDGASDQAIRSEAIVTVANRGTGPDAVTKLRFEGDVPQPTPEDFEKSGIYDTESDIGGHRNQVVFEPEAESVVYSNSRPFSPTGSNVSCGNQGQFTVLVSTQVFEDVTTSKYKIGYQGGDQLNCEISISEV